MNSTNRGLNRAILLVVGLVLLAAGAAATTAVLWPVFGQAWTTTVGGALGWARDTSAATPLYDGTTLSWLVVAVLAALALLIVLAIVVLAHLGGRRSRTVLRATGAESPLGPVTVQESFASDAIRNTLSVHEEILASSVSANEVKGRPVLHVSVTPRQNTSPRAVAELLARLTDNLATLTGQDIPTYISIHTGLRARLATDARRVN
ncbi:hypothetical protein GCM10010988_28230 [Cnuibacter physcomitrellae]|uniref:Uncharacterized protein n=1 Tax=Cnuibacter physcomitrellae TaxID=1619308 RepID=A0A1X9LJK2_9MICO|nr:hypothetical protein [Cnuibacter physcomitrellae]ARJ04101.1 hypothetical protein B5808_01840 [Cnuibacter physcomitrellae]GGI40268.1 hypothetical protein GCM10010988_28230 [Cnuibacter physcomitrellae]